MTGFKGVEEEFYTVENSHKFFFYAIGEGVIAEL